MFVIRDALNFVKNSGCDAPDLHRMGCNWVLPASGCWCCCRDMDLEQVAGHSATTTRHFRNWQLRPADGKMTDVAPFFKSGPKSGSGASPTGSEEPGKGQPRAGSGQTLGSGSADTGIDPEDVLGLAADPRASVAPRGPISRRAAERVRVATPPPPVEAPLAPKFSPARVEPSRVVTQSPPIIREQVTRRANEGTVFGSAESLSGTILADTHTRLSEPLWPRILDVLAEHSNNLGAVARKLVPRSSQLRLGLVGAAILVLGITLKIAFSHPVATLRINANYPFRAAQVIVWVDQEEALNDVMTGGSGIRHRAYPYQSFLGGYTRPLTVPAGPHVIRVRVAATDEGFDQVRTLNLKLKKDSDITLQISCGARSMAVATVDLKAIGKLRKSAQRVEASVWFEHYASPVFFSLGGSAMSAAVAFFIQEILKRARTKVT